VRALSGRSMCTYTVTAARAHYTHGHCGQSGHASRLLLHCLRSSRVPSDLIQCYRHIQVHWCSQEFARAGVRKVRNFANYYGENNAITQHNCVVFSIQCPDILRIILSLATTFGLRYLSHCKLFLNFCSYNSPLALTGLCPN